jgi:hypothetical protein
MQALGCYSPKSFQSCSFETYRQGGVGESGRRVGGSAGRRAGTWENVSAERIGASVYYRERNGRESRTRTSTIGGVRISPRATRSPELEGRQVIYWPLRVKDFAGPTKISTRKNDEISLWNSLWKYLTRIQSVCPVLDTRADTPCADTLCPRRHALRRYADTFPPPLPNQKRPDCFQRTQIDSPFLLSYRTLAGMIEPAGQRLES